MSWTVPNMFMQDLVPAIEIKEIRGDFFNPNIQRISSDGNVVNKNSIFVARKGLRVDGHDFINQAIDNGCRVIILEQFPEQLRSEVCYIKVADSTQSYAQLNRTLHGNPDLEMNIIGITGTNGKTTISTLLYRLLLDCDINVGLISTISIEYADQVMPSTHTTPDAAILFETLSRMLHAGVSHVVMEVSSHSLIQKRVFGLDFDIAVFTNLSHDHIDYHGSFANYRDAKKLLFDGLRKTATALVNIDDKNAGFMLQNCGADKKYYSRKRVSDFRSKIVEQNLEGTEMSVNDVFFFTRLIGDYNVENVTAVFAVAHILGLNKNIIAQKISALKSVKGRMELIKIGEEGLTGLIDFAHSPDALERLLKAVREIHRDGKIILVIGAGGDRDASKRSKMGAIACKYADLAVFTSDNPRSEDPQLIIEDMMMGVNEDCKSSLLCIVDRKQALLTACRLATPQDLVVVAGKGHEETMEIKGVKLPFNDRAILLEEFMLNKA